MTITKATLYSKTFMFCPHCHEATDSQVDHLVEGQTFGPWYCSSCGCEFSGKMTGEAIEITGCKRRLKKTLDLLVLPPNDKPIYFVVSGSHMLDATGRPAEGSSDESKSYFYEEYSCPVNVISRTQLVSVGGNTDPHGILRYLRSIPDESSDGEADEDDMLGAFPELEAK